MKIKKLIPILGLAIATASTGAFAQQDFKQGGDLTLVTKLVDAHVRNFNPYNDAVGQYYAKDFVYEMLWIPNILHPDQDIPVLATSYEVSEDLKSVTFNLRKGITWSDGKAFTADDVVFTVNYASKHPDFNIENINWYNQETNEGSVIGVKKLDDHRVRFDLNQPNALAHIGLGQLYPLPKHIWQDIKDPANFRNENPVATGPFTNVTKFTQTVFKLCRNDDYWQDNKPYVDCLVFPQYSSNTQAESAASLGDIDWLGVGMSNPKAYSKRSENNKYWLPAGGNVNLQLNTTKAPFNNLAFRQAMSIAINRDDLVEFATFGLTTATKYPIGTGEFYKAWYDEEHLAQYKYLMEYDAKRAAKILDDAGIVDADGDGWRDNADGSAIKFKMSVPSGWTDWVNSVMQISENLQDIGINAIAHTPDENAWFEAVPKGDFDVYMMWTHSNVVPWGTYNDLFNPADMVEGSISYQAMHQMVLPELKTALDNFAKTADRVEQRKQLNIVHEQVAQNLPIIALFANPEWYQYNTSEFEGWASEENPFVRPMVHGGIAERWAHVLNIHQK